MSRIPVVVLDGDKVARLIRMRLMTRKAFAKTAKLSPHTVTAAARGEPIRLIVAHKIAKALCVPLNTLVSDPTPDIPARAIG